MSRSDRSSGVDLLHIGEIWQSSWGHARYGLRYSLTRECHAAMLRCRYNDKLLWCDNRIVSSDYWKKNPQYLFSSKAQLVGWLVASLQWFFEQLTNFICNSVRINKCLSREEQTFTYDSSVSWKFLEECRLCIQYHHGSESVNRTLYCTSIDDDDLKRDSFRLTLADLHHRVSLNIFHDIKWINETLFLKYFI